MRSMRPHLAVLAAASVMLSIAMGLRQSLDIFMPQLTREIAGIAFVSHQLGSFVGAFGGGVIYDRLGSYNAAWQFGVAVGLAAGLAQVLSSRSHGCRKLAG